MSERINMLLQSTASTDTGGDETRGSFVSHSSRSSGSSDDCSTETGSSYSSSGKSFTEGEEGSFTEVEEISMVDTCTTNFEDEDDASTSGSSGMESTETSHTEITQRSPGRSNAMKASSKEPKPAPVDIEPLIQPDLEIRKRNDSNLSSSRHNRIPGGAAAKLMLLGPKGSAEIEKDEDEIKAISSTESGKVNESAVNEKLVREMQEAKNEFSMGNSQRRSSLSNHQQQLHDLQRHYHRTADDASETSSVAVSTTPSFLNRNEIFHKTAAAAVAALLTPRVANVGQCPSDLYSVCSSIGPVGPTSPRSMHAETSRKAQYSEQQLHQPSNTVHSQNLLTPKAEQVLEELKNKMHDPSSTLTDLLGAIASPENVPKEQVRTDLGYMVRRKNACGALHVLTANSNNRIRICWTAGVLPALTSVLTDGMSHPSIDDSFPDRRTRDEYKTARIRAIAVLTNLSLSPKNRIAVFHTPDLIRALVFTVENDKEGLARRGCSALLALLAKCIDNRLLMLHIPGILETIRKVLHPRPPRVEPEKEETKKKSYPWTEGEDDDSDSSSHSGTESERGNGCKMKNNRKSSDKMGGGDTVSLDGESGSTPRVKGSKTPRELSGYDETVDELHRSARQNLFALLGHLVKEKENAYHLGREAELLETLVAVSNFKESTSHGYAIGIMANLTRHRLNKHLAFKPKSFVPALVEATQSPLGDARLHAIYALQNLSQEKSCRQELAISNNLIVALCDRCRNGEQEGERLAAISTLKNLCDEPANLIPMTNTPGCVSTLMHFAHGGANNGTKEIQVTDMMQYRACDALATLSHWLRKISTSGYALEAINSRGGGRSSGSGGLAKGQLFVPTLREVSWNQWQ
jgi:hypothetical protein